MSPISLSPLKAAKITLSPTSVCNQHHYVTNITCLNKIFLQQTLFLWLLKVFKTSYLAPSTWVSQNKMDKPNPFLVGLFFHYSLLLFYRKMEKDCLNRMVAENVFLLETSSFSATFSETDATRVVRHGFFDAKSREATSGRP